MANNLYPSYVMIQYHSSYGNHTMTLPTLRWTSTGLGLPGVFETHDTLGKPADEMVEELVALFRPLYSDSVIFDTYTIFDIPTLSLPIVANPVFQDSLALAGTDATPEGVDKAVQYTIGYRTTLYGRSQIVLLDKPAGNTWGNVTVPDAATIAISAEFTSDTNGWAGRDGGRPYTFTNISISMNKRLRRKYGMI